MCNIIDLLFCTTNPSGIHVLFKGKSLVPPKKKMKSISTFLHLEK